jgi:hypothetical protein
MKATKAALYAPSELRIPIIGIRAALLWRTLRENGFDKPMTGAVMIQHYFDL